MPGLTCYDKIISDKQPSIELMILTQDNSMLRTNQKTQCLLKSHMESIPSETTCPRQVWKLLDNILDRIHINLLYGHCIVQVYSEVSEKPQNPILV